MTKQKEAKILSENEDRIIEKLENDEIKVQTDSGFLQMDMKVFKNLYKIIEGNDFKEI